MRRSAAPSQIGHVSKRPRFQPPPATSSNQDGEIPQPVRTTTDVLSLIDRNSQKKKKPKSIRPFVSPLSAQNKRELKTQQQTVPAPSIHNHCGNNRGRSNPRQDHFEGHPDQGHSEGQGSSPGSNKEFVNGVSIERDSLDCLTQDAIFTKRGDANHQSSTESIDPEFVSPRTKINFEIAAQKKLNFKAFKIPTATAPISGSETTESTSEGKARKRSKDDTKQEVTRYFSVMWCKLSKKKHKTWEGDAILVAKGRSLTLLDMEGKEIGRGSGYKASELASLTDGNTLCIGSKEIEVMGTLSEAAFKTGQCFNTAPVIAPADPSTSTGHVKSTAPVKPFVKPTKVGECSTDLPAPTPQVVKPRYDPSAPDALVLPRPTQSQVWDCTKKGGSIVDVVVDPYLSQHLRPHQRKGVVFLYQCVMGMKDYGGQGAILADEMGLGKTLQCITLIWTLLKQGPFNGKPIAKKILIITPGSLVKNWRREVKKWLGTERLKVFAVGQDSKVEDFLHLAHHPVLIISYEMFVRTIETVRKVNFDLIVCDEGHRLKNTSIKTTTLVQSLTCRRRVVLTGTPVQNDLQELYSIVNFCNPAVLGSQSAFRRVYEEPILSSRQPGATAEARALGQERAAELGRITSMFILRRTSDINNKYLPPKVEVVLFCAPSRLQRELYGQLLSSPALRSCISAGDSGQHLVCISALKKLCNHPVLLHESAVQADAQDEAGGFNSTCDLYKDLLGHYPMTFDLDRPISADSGKLSVVENMLHDIHSNETSREKIVLVSNYTQTLNVLSTLCRCKGYSFLRLDGQTPTGKRQQIVERFNSRYSPELVFLLSSKAGGVGLNLIGASRLVLYDIDWNPANDLQAMARVWRDGQKRCVYIYRLLTTGTIEEKMYQRQISKQALSGVVVDSKNCSTNLCFSPEELRDLFTLHENTKCGTHSLLGCKCTAQDAIEVTSNHTSSKSNSKRKCQISLSSTSSNKNLCMDELLEWQHIAGPKPDLSTVDPLLSKDSLNTVTFAFYNECNKQLIPNDDGR